MQLIYLPKLALKIEGFVWDNKVVEERWPRTVILPLLQRYHMTRFSRWRKRSQRDSDSTLEERAHDGPINPIAEYSHRQLRIACSQTLYYLFKVRRARVIKHKSKGIY